MQNVCQFTKIAHEGGETATLGVRLRAFMIGLRERNMTALVTGDAGRLQRFRAAP